MDERARRYIKLRDSLQNLSKLSKKKCSTNEIMKQLDPLWRAMLKVRSAMIKQLDLPEKPSPLDFYALYCQIDNTRGKQVCSDCLSKFEGNICPFCWKQVEDMESIKDADVLIDFDAVNKQPNWDIKYSLNEFKKPLPKEIKPITKRNDIPGPKGKKKDRKKYTRGKSQLSASTVRMIRWERRRELCENFPYTLDFLNNLKRVDDLRSICTVLAKDFEEIRYLTKDQMIQFVLAKQPDKPIDPGPLPYGQRVKSLEGRYNNEDDKSS